MTETNYNPSYVAEATAEKTYTQTLLEEIALNPTFSDDEKKSLSAYVIAHMSDLEELNHRVTTLENTEIPKVEGIPTKTFTIAPYDITNKTFYIEKVDVNILYQNADSFQLLDPDIATLQEYIEQAYLGIINLKCICLYNNKNKLILESVKNLNPFNVTIGVEAGINGYVVTAVADASGIDTVVLNNDSSIKHIRNGCCKAVLSFYFLGSGANAQFARNGLYLISSRNFNSELYYQQFYNSLLKDLPVDSPKLNNLLDFFDYLNHNIVQSNYGYACEDVINRYQYSRKGYVVKMRAIEPFSSLEELDDTITFSTVLPMSDMIGIVQMGFDGKTIAIPVFVTQENTDSKTIFRLTYPQEYQLSAVYTDVNYYFIGTVEW